MAQTQPPRLPARQQPDEGYMDFSASAPARQLSPTHPEAPAPWEQLIEVFDRDMDATEIDPDAAMYPDVQVIPAEEREGMAASATPFDVLFVKRPVASSLQGDRVDPTTGEVTKSELWFIVIDCLGEVRGINLSRNPAREEKMRKLYLLTHHGRRSRGWVLVRRKIAGGMTYVDIVPATQAVPQQGTLAVIEGER